MMKTIMLAMLMASSLMAADKGNWQRVKECSAEKYGVTLLQSHYSPKYKHCYAYMYQEAFADDGWGLQHWMLSDVF